MNDGTADPPDGDSKGREYEPRRHGTPLAVRPVAETVAVMGIPESELTPKVHAAMTTLVEEVDRLRREVEAARSHMSRLERMADQDSLLPVSNRRAFVRELSRVISFSERYGMASSILYFDINAFKAINDTHGHAAGDAGLELVARILLGQVRDSDVVGRLGGDEFGVIMAFANHETATEKATNLVDMIGATPLIWNGETIPVTVAHGVYTFESGVDANRAIEAADKAMYARKRQTKKGKTA